MKRRFSLAAAAALFLAVIAVGSVSLFSAPESPPRQTHLVGDPQRGAYVLRLAGCVACHTNAKDGGKFLAGGAPLESGFGSFYPPNITPDLDEGIGAWSQADFFTAMTQGESPRGDAYYPAFPYAFYTNMSDQDIADLWAALRQVAPAESATDTAGANTLRFPVSWRILLRPWQRLFFQPGMSPPAVDSPSWQRGHYIVEGPGHCGACHTPRNPLGARKRGAALAGTRIAGERVPAITAAELKQDGWSIEDVVFALETGLTPQGDVFGGVMGEVVRDSTSHLTPQDLHAIAIYLLTAQGEGE